jgi:hypothetical protein
MSKQLGCKNIWPQPRRRTGYVRGNRVLTFYGYTVSFLPLPLFRSLEGGFLSRPLCNKTIIPFGFAAYLLSPPLPRLARSRNAPLCSGPMTKYTRFPAFRQLRYFLEVRHPTRGVAGAAYSVAATFSFGGAPLFVRALFHVAICMRGTHTYTHMHIRTHFDSPCSICPLCASLSLFLSLFPECDPIF